MLLVAEGTEPSVRVGGAGGGGEGREMWLVCEMKKKIKNIL